MRTWLLRERNRPRMPPIHPGIEWICVHEYIRKILTKNAKNTVRRSPSEIKGGSSGCAYVCCMSLTDQTDPLCSVNVLTEKWINRVNKMYGWFYLSPVESRVSTQKVNQSANAYP